VIPFCDLQTQFRNQEAEYVEAMAAVCRESGYILGKAASRFEQEFAAYLGVKHAVGVGSGTDALRLALRVLGIGQGDEVLVPANTFIATALAVHMVGGIPVPVDIDPETHFIDVMDAERRVTPKTRGIIPVHLYGQCMNLAPLQALAARHNLVVIEDAAQAAGASFGGRMAGAMSAAGCFSFYPAKNLGCFGDGGMVVTNDDGCAHQLRLWRNYGQEPKNVHVLPGCNSRLDALQAAVLSVKLPHLDGWNRTRFDLARLYASELHGLPQVKTPTFDHDAPEQHIFHLMILECEDRDGLGGFLTKQSIQWGVHYPTPWHLQASFAALGHDEGTCPAAETMSKRIISLPIYPEMTTEQVRTVCTAVGDFYRA
jgi:dTDP-4-amino-4,6-dideoxygalactose transaminase